MNYNLIYGIFLDVSDYNEITYNFLVGNGQCIVKAFCIGNIIENNICKKEVENPIIIINSPFNGDLFGITPPVFNLTIIESNLDKI